MTSSIVDLAQAEMLEEDGPLSLSSLLPTHQQDTTLPSPGDPSDSTWEVLNREHFFDGFGVFQEVDSEDTHHYASKLGREGVDSFKQVHRYPRTQLQSILTS